MSEYLLRFRINSIPSLVHIMACCMLCVKASTELMLTHCQLDTWWQISMKFQSNVKRFHLKTNQNVVCKMAGILSRPRHLKGRLIIHLMLSIHTRLYGNSRDVQIIYHVRDTLCSGIRLRNSLFCVWYVHIIGVSLASFSLKTSARINHKNSVSIQC